MGRIDFDYYSSLPHESVLSCIVSVWCILDTHLPDLHPGEHNRQDMIGLVSVFISVSVSVSVRSGSVSRSCSCSPSLFWTGVHYFALMWSESYPSTPR